MKIEIGVFEMSNMSNFNKLQTFLILGPIWAWQVVNVSQKLFLTLYEQLITGYSLMNFYISTNYFKKHAFSIV